MYDMYQLMELWRDWCIVVEEVGIFGDGGSSSHLEKCTDDIIWWTEKERERERAHNGGYVQCFTIIRGCRRSGI